MLCGMTGGFAFCKTNGFSCTFHDPRHTLTTMMVAGGYGGAIMGSITGTPKHREPDLTFSVEQLKTMLAAAEEKEASHGVFKLIWRFVRWLFRAVSRWM